MGGIDQSPEPLQVPSLIMPNMDVTIKTTSLGSVDQYPEPPQVPSLSMPNLDVTRKASNRHLPLTAESLKTNLEWLSKHPQLNHRQSILLCPQVKPEDSLADDVHSSSRCDYCGRTVKGGRDGMRMHHSSNKTCIKKQREVLEVEDERWFMVRDIAHWKSYTPDTSLAGAWSTGQQRQ